MPKPDLMVLIGKGRHKEGDSEDEESESSDVDEQEYEDLGAKALQAIKDDDGMAFGLAVKALVEECMKGHEK